MDRGHNCARTVRLFVRTGLEDDRRRPLEPGDSLYLDALRAWKEQDESSPDYHARAWSAMLPVWPRAGRRPIVDAQSAAAAHLAQYEVPLDVIADVLGL